MAPSAYVERIVDQLAASLQIADLNAAA